MGNNYSRNKVCVIGPFTSKIVFVFGKFFMPSHVSVVGHPKAKLYRKRLFPG